jgi:AraC-like DNA-binding protein
MEEAIYLQTGDVVALPHGRAFCLAGDPSTTPVDIMKVLSAPLKGRIVSWNGGGACLALSALFTFSGDQAQMLLGVLPLVIHIRNDADRVTMRWYLERMMEVARESRPGGVLLGEHLAQMMLIEVLRLHLEDRVTSKIGWLFALADQPICTAMTAMHGDPGRRWTLQELARLAGMSRSAFAVRFKEKVGVSAMDYLIRWRMLLAADKLVKADEPVAAVARSLGYESESAFGFAFKREMGCSPRQYCRTRVSAQLGLAG